MSSDRIAQLHEQASERYLNGDYDGALQAWRDVLTMDPANEQAMDGVRMASQFAEPVATAPEAPGEIENELEAGLKVFDSLGAPSGVDLGATMILNRGDVDAMIDRKPVPVAAESPTGPDPRRQSEGIDFGDLSSVDAIPLGAERPAVPDDSSGHEDHGLAPTPEMSAAAVELNRRVADLLAEARARADAGEAEEALAILSRLAILDEDNPDAAALSAQLRDASASALGQTEEAIIEGVAALESDRLDDAERHFRDALALSPDHREAQHYLEKIGERRSGTWSAHGENAHAVEDLLGGADLTGSRPAVEVPGGDAAPLGTPHGRKHATPSSAWTPRSAPSASLEAAVSAPTSRFPLPPLKWVLFGGLGAIAVACVAIALPHLSRGSSKPVPVPPPARTNPPPKARSATPSSASTAAAPLSPAELSRAVAASIARGQSRMAGGDFGGAVLSFNEALTLDPASSDAKRGLDEAAGLYKARKAEQESLHSILLAFRDGEYASALRVAYRLPPSIPREYTDGVKVAGWYNLAVVALRAGECREALSHLDEALGVVPTDAEATKLREFAVRYAEIPKDRSFLNKVEALSFRPVPPS